ncbi:MAG: response regulator transcription factor [Alphaproteobacteria bacterium]|nr:response regulator transcription factor [Alphaproteobacteria bacterium]
MRVLIIEDDPTMANIIRLTLEAENYDCALADLGRDGLKAAKDSNFDIIILDLMLPDIGGYEVLSKLRVAQIEAPVLILSGFAEADGAGDLENAGVSDFLAKPFNRRILVDRVAALIRNSAGAGDTVIRTGKVSVNITTGTVDVMGRPIDLSEKEYRVLQLLSLRKGKIVPQASFLIHLYDAVDIPEDPSIIEEIVRSIRHKLTRANGTDFYIDSIPDRGYVLYDPVAADLPAHRVHIMGA